MSKESEFWRCPSPLSFSPLSFSPLSFSPLSFSPLSFSPLSFSPLSFSPLSFSPTNTPLTHQEPHHGFQVRVGALLGVNPQPRLGCTGNLPTSRISSGNAGLCDLNSVDRQDLASLPLNRPQSSNCSENTTGSVLRSACRMPETFQPRLKMLDRPNPLQGPR